jgi:hypothetical protein
MRPTPYTASGFFLFLLIAGVHPALSIRLVVHAHFNDCPALKNHPVLLMMIEYMPPDFPGLRGLGFFIALLSLYKPGDRISIPFLRKPLLDRQPLCYGTRARVAKPGQRR